LRRSAASGRSRSWPRSTASPEPITQWKRQAIENLAEAFDDNASDAQVGREAEVMKLHAKIGQLVVERDLAKAFDR
jgi:transposase